MSWIPGRGEVARGATVHVARDRATGTSTELTDGMMRILRFLEGIGT